MYLAKNDNEMKSLATRLAVGTQVHIRKCELWYNAIWIILLRSQELSIHDHYYSVGKEGVRVNCVGML